MSGGFQQALADLQAAGRRREPPVVEPLEGGRARIEGREVVVLCSNDYLGFAHAPELAGVASEAAYRWGVGAGGSRLISGTLPVHRQAEARLARFVRMDRAVLFPSGYQANVGAVTSAVSEGDWVISDALNHASLIDGCRLSRATVRVVPHCDPGAIEAILRIRPAQGNCWIVTEALFSMDGDEADLGALAALVRAHGAGLLVDEAHSLGVFGPGGSGLCQAAAVVPDLLVGTLGKALGCAGAFVAGTHAAGEWLENRARSFVYTTAIAPPLAAVASAAAELVTLANDRRAKVLALAATARELLQAGGVDVVPGRGPILPILVGEDRRVMEVSKSLLEQGFFVQGIRPPTVPLGTGRLRVTLSAAHEAEDVKRGCLAIIHALAP